MPVFALQAYNMLSQMLLFNITPVLAGSGGGTLTRLPVGSPETIPQFTFITRRITATDDRASERARLNRFIDGAITYHTNFGLAPIMVNSIEDILLHYNTRTGFIKRFRLVTHGFDEFVFAPLFTNGSWAHGIQENRLNAFKTSNEEGLRFLVSGHATASPTLPDMVTDIINGIRAVNASLLAPFPNPATPPVQKFFDLINDFFQVRNSLVVASTTHEHAGAPATFTQAFMDATQQSTLIDILNLIETDVRSRLPATITTAQLDALKTAASTFTPMQLGLLGPIQNLDAQVFTNITNAGTAHPGDAAALRDAILAGAGEPIFTDFTHQIHLGLRVLHPTTLHLGTATDPVDMATINADTNLGSFFNVCGDLFFAKHGPINVGGTPITAPQRTSLRNALRTLGGIFAPAVTTATAAQLSTLRTTVEGMTVREGISLQTTFIDTLLFPDMRAARTAINGGFRQKLEHFRTLIDAQSHIDIRGCLVGHTPSFLDTLGDFFANGATKPIISAPNWFQSFPGASFFGGWGSSIFTDIDNLLLNGIDTPVHTGTPHATTVHTSSSDITDSFDTWKGMIDFPAHFTFISALFSVPTAKFDFATLAWRTWASGGIPPLRMEAQRIDDITSLNLGQIIERFRIIFEIASANAPNPTARTQLTALQPHIASFKSIRDLVSPITNASDPGLPGHFTSLTQLATQVTGIAGLPAPASPLTPASASLADLQASVQRFQTHIDAILATHLGTLFTQINAVLAGANPQLKYYYNIGLPLLLKSSALPTVFRISSFMSAGSANERRTQTLKAFQSWMKIHWTGTDPQAITHMNTAINAMTAANDDALMNPTRSSVLVSGDAEMEATSPWFTTTAESAINPMPDFQTHIITRP